MVGIPWAESYLGQLRAAAGDRTLIFIGARGVLRDAEGRVLLIRRSDNGMWAIPAGAMELGETIAECAVREVFEETGLTAEGIAPFAFYTGPDYTFTNMYGHTYQHFLVAFHAERWSGELLRSTDETIDAGFFLPGDLPPGTYSESVHRTLADLDTFQRTGQVVMR